MNLNENECVVGDVTDELSYVEVPKNFGNDFLKVLRDLNHKEFKVKRKDSTVGEYMIGPKETNGKTGTDIRVLSYILYKKNKKGIYREKEIKNTREELLKYAR